MVFVTDTNRVPSEVGLGMFIHYLDVSVKGLTDFFFCTCHHYVVKLRGLRLTFCTGQKYNVAHFSGFTLHERIHHQTTNQYWILKVTVSVKIAVISAVQFL